jgi:hypothetical protein
MTGSLEVSVGSRAGGAPLAPDAESAPQPTAARHLRRGRGEVRRAPGFEFQLISDRVHAAKPQ